MSVYILKDKNEQKLKLWKIPKQEKLRGTWPRYFAVTKTGYMNKKVWHSILLQFQKQWKTLYPDLHCILYMDNCSSHRSDVDIDVDSILALNLAHKGIHSFFLPPNTTAWLQPLDDVCFGNFKTMLGREHADLCFEAAVASDFDYRLTLDDAIRIESLSFSGPTIRKSWYATGMSCKNDLSRIDPVKIMAKANSSLGICQFSDSLPNQTIDFIQRLANTISDNFF
jgi:DDE superfamily endonuclease